MTFLFNFISVLLGIVLFFCLLAGMSLLAFFYPITIGTLTLISLASIIAMEMS